MSIRKKKILVICLILCLISSVSISFAWFITNGTVSITNADNYSVEVSNLLKVSFLKSDGTWSEYGDKITLTDTYLEDVTGDGINFRFPSTLNLQDQALYPLTDIVDDDDITGKYIELKLKVKSKSKFDLHLSNLSYVLPLDESTTNNSLYGNFTANYIAGAARVCVTEVTTVDNVETETIKQIWIPNDKYQLSYSVSSGSASFTKIGSRESSYGYYENDYTNSKISKVNYTIADYLSKKVAIGNSILAIQEENLVNMTAPITSFVNEGVDEVKRINIRLWIEGSDREAAAPLNQGKIKFRIAFCGIANKTDDSEASDYETLSNIYIGKQNGILYTDKDNTTPFNESNKIQYSYNGIDWYTYTYTYTEQTINEQTIVTETGLPYYYSSDAEKNQSTQYVYIKQFEDLTHVHSTVYKLDLINMKSEKIYPAA